MQRIIGILLIVVGALMLAYQGFTYTKRERVIDIGSVHVNADRKKTVPLPPIIGGATIAAGVLLIVAGPRREV